MVDAGPLRLYLSADNLSALHFKPSLLCAVALRPPVSPDGHHDSVHFHLFAHDLACVQLRFNLYFVALFPKLLYGFDYGIGHHVYALLLELFRDLVGHVFVELAQEARTVGQNDIVAKAPQEASAFNRDVASTNDQSLAWIVLEREQIVARDRVLRELWEALVHPRAHACSDHK